MARAELVLGRGNSAALRTVPLRPDALHSIAEALADIRAELGESATIDLDLLALSPARARYLGRRAAHAGGAGPGLLQEIAEAIRDDAAGRRQRPRRDRLPTARVPASKLLTTEPMFAAQLLLRVESEIPNRAQAHLQQLLSAFEMWAGENWWKVAGGNVATGLLGSDSRLYRRRFDRRHRTGAFRPRRTSLVSVSEILPLLKPPTKFCAATNVARSGGMVPPVPSTLPVWKGQPDMLPLGWVRGPKGVEHIVGMWLAELFFSFRQGKARFGKTETALVHFLWLALSGHGTWFLDPHADAWTRARPYLAGREVRDRVWEIDLTVRGDDQTVAGWNLLSMEGVPRSQIEDKVDTVVTAFDSALGWNGNAPRATTILAKAAESLCELAVQLPPQYAPTLFQITTLLEDAAWREEMLPFLPKNLRDYWQFTYDKYPAEASTPITNLINRLRTSPTLTAFLGSSQSSYDVRRAMDTGAVVVVCPPPGGLTTKLVSCFLIFDLFRAGRSRGDLPPEKRRRFDAFIDELTQVDGAAKGYLAAVLEQLGKFRVALHAMTQMANRLTQQTQQALLQNQSYLSSSAGSIDAVRVVTRQWGKQVEPETVAELPKYHHVMSVQNNGKATTPFKVRGATVTELFDDYLAPDLEPQMADILDATLQRRRIGDIRADLDRLDEQILLHLHAAPGRPQPSTAHRAEPTSRGSGAPGSDVTPTPPAGASEDPYGGLDEPVSRVQNPPSEHQQPDNVITFPRRPRTDD